MRRPSDHSARSRASRLPRDLVAGLVSGGPVRGVPASRRAVEIRAIRAAEMRKLAMSTNASAVIPPAAAVIPPAADPMSRDRPPD